MNNLSGEGKLSPPAYLNFHLSKTGKYSLYKEANKEKINAASLAYYHANPERSKETGRRYRQNIRETVILHYGSKCACCGEAAVEFLGIDHINGGGNKERTASGLTGGTCFYRHIIKQGFPDCYRLLCHNCNFSRGAYGYCPHEKARLTLVS